VAWRSDLLPDRGRVVEKLFRPYPVTSPRLQREFNDAPRFAVLAREVLAREVLARGWRLGMMWLRVIVETGIVLLASSQRKKAHPHLAFASLHSRVHCRNLRRHQGVRCHRGVRVPRADAWASLGARSSPTRGLVACARAQARRADLTLTSRCHGLNFAEKQCNRATEFEATGRWRIL
jgi:hypothetical protein